MFGGFKQCGVKEAERAVAGGAGQLVDVREYAEYETERVTGAKLAPLSALEANLEGLERGRTIYLMCRSGRRAAQAAERLAARGFADMCVIEGGLRAWAEAGLPVERGGRRVWSLERQVRFVAGTLVLTGVLLSLVSPWLILLSTFVGAGLAFSAITDTCGMALVLARMPWNQRPKGIRANSLGAS